MRSQNIILNEHSGITSVSSMEDLIINSKEHRLLKKFKRRLQKRFDVQICMPKGPSCDSDIMFVSLHGEEENRMLVKTFLSEKMTELEKKNNTEKIPLITLSDSESDSSAELDDSVVELSVSVPPEPNSTPTLDDSVCILEISAESENRQEIPFFKSEHPKRLKRKKVPYAGAKCKVVSCASAELIQNDVTDERVRKKIKASESATVSQKSIDMKPAVEFIPLEKENKCVNHLNNKAKTLNDKKSYVKCEVNNDDEIVVIDDPVAPVIPRKLRPIVIDGSNVAREHGKVSHCFSVKGIQIAIDYFLVRGHTQVTAFVPLFRRNPSTKRLVPTTDAFILDELEKKQLVVFTPSRTVNNKRISSYDDRYIVKLAAANKGVIVSNDNYRDLINENETYKEAIENRLLPFCFVGDIFMVPDDPLGRTGPSINEFLSFPPDDETT